MYREIIDFTRWVLEVFPATVPTFYHVEYAVSIDRIVWKYEKAADDVNDNLQLLIFGVKIEFFEKVIVPGLAKIDSCETSWKTAGKDRIIVTFTPFTRRHFGSSNTLFSAFGSPPVDLGVLWLDRPPFHVVNSGEPPPPQE